MRDLASICTVASIIPMLNKDRIVDITFTENGYECIVPKENTNIGDKLIFIQEGSILPEKPCWEFLRKRCYKENLHGFLISPMTMGQKVDGTRVKSWGLAVTFSDAGITDNKVINAKAGTDLTDLLEIRKYEPEDDASPSTSKKTYPWIIKFCLGHKLTRWIGNIYKNLHKNESGGFPTDVISKSDETTVQNYKSVITTFANSEVYISAKMEGQSGTALCPYDQKKKKLGKFYVCSRNNAYKNPIHNDFWNFAKKYDVEKKLRDYYKTTGVPIVIQFEQCGPGIQQNIYNFPETRWFIYEIKSLLDNTQLSYDDMMKCAKELKLETVPIIKDTGVLKDIMPDVDTAVKYAEGLYWTLNDSTFVPIYNPKDTDKLWTDYFQHEGCVVRSKDCDKDKNVGCSFKVKNIAYSEQGLGKIAASAKSLKYAVKSGK